MSIPQVHSRSPAQKSSGPWCALDAELRVVAVDAQWDARLEGYGFDPWRRAEVLGRPFEEHIAPADRASWRQWLHSLITPAAPSHTEGPPSALTTSQEAPWRQLIAWPEHSHPKIRLWLGLRSGTLAALRRPWVYLAEGAVKPLNRAARRLLEADRSDGARLGAIGLQDAGMLARWLGALQPPASLQPVPALRWRNQPVYWAIREPGRDGSGMRRLTQMMRSGLHDLSNPLAALRMQVEMIGRCIETDEPLKQALDDSASYVDQTIEVIRDLRKILHASPSIETFDLGQEARRAAHALLSEVGRRELHLEVIVPEGQPVKLEANRSDIRLLIATLLLASLDHGDVGDSLKVMVEHGDGPRLSCYMVLGHRPSTPRLVDDDGDFLRALADQCDAQLSLSIEPFSWCLELP